MPIMNPKPRLDDLPEPIRAAYRDRVLLPLPTLAKLLDMHPQTLRALVKQGKIGYRHRGIGGPRRHKHFAIDDVAAMWHTMRAGPVVGPTGAHHGQSYSALRQERAAQKR
jgi:hypothetical protein